MKQLLMPAIAGALVAMSGAALADTAVSAVADLNVRAGPGPRYPVVGVLPAGQPAALQGCMENSKWCTIAEADGQGWVYSDYLTADFGAGPVVLTDRPTDSDIAIVQPPSDIGDYPDNYTAAIAPGDAVEPVDDLVGRAPVNIADEAQGDVIVLDVDPAGSGQAAAQQGKAQCHVAGNFEGGKQSRHDKLPESCADDTSESRKGNPRNPYFVPPEIVARKACTAVKDFSTMTSTPPGFGCMPSSSCSPACAATPSRKKA